MVGPQGVTEVSVLYRDAPPPRPRAARRRQRALAAVAFVVGFGLGAVAWAGMAESRAGGAVDVLADEVRGVVYVPGERHHVVPVHNGGDVAVEVTSARPRGWDVDESAPAAPVRVPAHQWRDVPLAVVVDCDAGSVSSDLLELDVRTPYGAERSVTVPLPGRGEALTRAAADFCGDGERAAPTPRRLAGVWILQESRETQLLQLGADGRFAVDSLGQLLDPAGWGSYTVDGRTVTLTFAGGRSCERGDQWAWHGGLAASQLRVVTVHSPGGRCAVDVGSVRTFHRVSPASLRTVQVRVDRAAPTASPVRGLRSLHGTWLLADGGLLWIGGDHEFALDPAGDVARPADGGTVVLVGADRLELVSDGDSRVCPAGARAVLHGVRVAGPELRAASLGDDCAQRGDLAGAWVRLAP